MASDSDPQAPDSQPHDMLIRYLFSKVEHVATYLRSVLPPSLLRVLDLEHLKLMPTSFITGGFREKRTDVLLHVPRKDSSPDDPGVFIYVLLEHQREPDHLIPLRLLCYTVGIWEGWLRSLPPGKRRGPLKLPPVLPIVLYQGNRAWNVARDLVEMTNLEGFDGLARQELRSHLANQRYQLHNLRQSPDDGLGGQGMTRVALVVMKHIDSPELARVLTRLLGELLDGMERDEPDPNTDLQDVRMILRYILSASKHINAEEMVELVEPLGKQTQEAVMTEAQRLIQKGFEQGIEQGAEEKGASIARALLHRGMKIAEVASVTGLSLARVRKLSEK